MKNFLVLLLVSFLLFTLSCKKEDSSPVSPGEGGSGGKISTGATTDLTTQVIGSSGGIIKISRPGDKLDGLELTVPSDAFTTSKNFKISYSDIKSHQFGVNFNPISPLISVTYDGGYSAKGMTVKIPISLPKGHFAMGFFYDETAGTLEGIPILSLDSASITIATKTFSAASSLSKRNGINDLTSIGKMIITSINESNLNSQTIISSGFQLGVDDWEFINYGSYIAPGGHCAGQSMAAMWYYYEKKLRGAKPLFHLMDTYNDKTKPTQLWQDNPLGYRFSSTIQKDCNWNGWVNDMEFRSVFPALVWNAFALSMLVTGEPQSVLIRNSNGEGGHAMIVYKINFNEKKLYIADPNYPNNRDWNGNESIRTIDYVNGILKPYETGLVAGANSTSMDQIAYFGKTAYIDWGQLNKRWAEVENKTIGNDRFPAYELNYLDTAKWLPLTDNIKVKKDTLRVYCRSLAPAQYIANTDHYHDLSMYDESGKLLSSGDPQNGGCFLTILKPGINKIGFYFTFYKDGGWKYGDFKWLNVNYDTTGVPVISAIIPLNAKVNEDVVIIGSYFGTDKTKGKVFFFDNVEATSITSWTNNRIDLKIPEGAKPGNVYVIVQNIKSKNYPYTVKIVPPAVTSISKFNGVIGDTITITGTDFGAAQGNGKVFFGDKQAGQIVSWSATKIVATVPAIVNYSSKIYVEAGGNKSAEGYTFTTYNWWLPYRYTFSFVEPNAGVSYSFNDGTSGGDISFMMAFPVSIKWDDMKFTADTTKVEVQNYTSVIYTTTTKLQFSGELDKKGMNLILFEGLKIQYNTSKSFYNNKLIHLDSIVSTIQFKLKNVPYYGTWTTWRADGSASYDNPNFYIMNSAPTFELVGHDVLTIEIDYNTTPVKITEKLKSSTGYSNVRYSQLKIGVPAP